MKNSIALVLTLSSLALSAPGAFAKDSQPTSHQGLVQVQIFSDQDAVQDARPTDVIEAEIPRGGLTVAAAVAKAASRSGGRWNARFDAGQTRLEALGDLEQSAGLVDNHGKPYGYGFYFVVDGKPLKENIFDAKVKKTITIRYVKYYSRSDKGAQLGNFVIKPAKR
jgi:hypothetical protein